MPMNEWRPAEGEIFSVSDLLGRARRSLEHGFSDVWTEGEILGMGRSLGAVGLRAWRDCLGAVMQEDQLFAGTIAEIFERLRPGIPRRRADGG